MPAQSQAAGLDIVISAIDKASKTLKDIQKDVDGVTKAVDSHGKKSKDTWAEVKNLAKAFTIGSLAADAIKASLRFVNDGLRAVNETMRSSVEAASKYEMTMRGLDSTAEAFGHSASEVRKAALKLSEDGLLTPAQSAEALKNVLAGLKFATLDQGVAMVAAMKDTAAYNRVLYDYGDAIIQTTRGVRNRNSILTDSAGVQKNLSIIMKESGMEIQDLDDASKGYAATQAFINGYLNESVFAAGDAADSLNTYQGQLAQMNAQLNESKVLLGQVLTPAFSAFTEMQKDVLSGITSWLQANKGKITTIAANIGSDIKSVIQNVGSFFSENRMTWEAIVTIIGKASLMIGSALKAIANAFQIAVRIVMASANTIGSAFKTVEYALNPTKWGKIGDVWKDWAEMSNATDKSIVGDFEDIGDSAKMFTDGIEFTFEDAWNNIKETTGKAGDDIKDQQAEDWLAAIATSNAALDKMNEDLTKANEKYAREVGKRQKAFQESFDDLVRAHRDTIEQLTEDLAKENNEYKKELVELESEFNKSMEDIEKRHSEKTRSILADMEEERKKALANIEEINEKYTEQRTLLQSEGADRISDLQGQLDRELALKENGNKDTVAMLRAMIDAEQDGLDSSLEGLQDKNDEEVADVRETLDDRLGVLQTGMDDENAEYADAIAERAVMYEEDTAAAKESFTERTTAIETEMAAELVIRESYAADFARVGDTQAADDLTRLIQSHADELEEMQRAHAEQIAEMQSASTTMGEIKDDLKLQILDANEAAKLLHESVLDLIFSPGAQPYVNQPAPVFGDLSTPLNYPMLGNGGIATQQSMVAEDGQPEAVLPLSKPKRMQQILDGLGIRGNNGGTVQQTFYVNVEKPFDVDLIMERAGFAYKQGSFA